MLYVPTDLPSGVTKNTGDSPMEASPVFSVLPSLLRKLIVDKTVYG